MISTVRDFLGRQYQGIVVSGYVYDPYSSSPSPRSYRERPRGERARIGSGRRRLRPSDANQNPNQNPRRLEGVVDGSSGVNVVIPACLRRRPRRIDGAAATEYGTGISYRRGWWRGRGGRKIRPTTTTPPTPQNIQTFQNILIYRYNISTLYIEKIKYVNQLIFIYSF